MRKLNKFIIIGYLFSCLNFVLAVVSLCKKIYGINTKDVSNILGLLVL